MLFLLPLFFLTPPSIPYPNPLPISTLFYPFSTSIPIISTTISFSVTSLHLLSFLLSLFQSFPPFSLFACAVFRLSTSSFPITHSFPPSSIPSLYLLLPSTHHPTTFSSSNVTLSISLPSTYFLYHPRLSSSLPC